MRLLTVISYALSAASFVQGAGPHSRVACATTWGPNTLRNVPSYTQTNKIFKSEEVIIHSCKSTKTATITPKPTTVTSVVSKDATRTITNKRLTATTTIAKTATSTTTKMERVTSTSTTTRTLAVLITSIETVPTPAGFTAVADSPNFVAKQKRDTAASKSQEELEKDPRNLMAWFEGPDNSVHRRWQPKSNKNKYAQRVICTNWITSTATQTTTVCTRTPTRTVTLPRRTSTSRITKTKTATRTINPAKTTRTVTLTKQTTVTEGRLQVIKTTETKTVTTTSVAAKETVYAACAPNNLVSTFGGQPITNVNGYEGTKWRSIQGAVTPLECCIKCFQSEDCLGSAAWEGNCVHGVHEDPILKREPEPWTCKAGGGLNPDGYFYHTNDVDYKISVSNGPCGRWGPILI